MDKIKIFYISNTRKIEKDFILDGHDAHLWHSLNALINTGNEILIDSNFYEISENIKRLDKNVNLIARTSYHFISILKLIFGSIPRMHSILISAKPKLVYERSAFFQYYFLSPKFIRSIRSLYFLEVHAPPEEIKDIGIKSLFYRCAEWIEVLKYRQADAIFTVSITLKNYISHHYNINPNKIFVMPNGVNKNIFYEDNCLRKIQRNALRLQNKIVVCFVGASHIPWHNLELLCKSIEMLKESLNLFFLFVGLETKDLMLRGIDISKIAHKIICVGPKIPEEINSYLNASDICVLPGTNWYCSPMKLFEYGAVNKAVIAVDMFNVREILKKDNLVIFFKKGDAYDLAKKIKLLSDNKELRREIGKNLKDYILDSFSWDNNARKIIDVFKKLYMHSYKKINKVALLCSGLGQVKRGFESFTEELYTLLRDDIDVTLFKGGGRGVENREIVLKYLNKDGIMRFTYLPIGVRRFIESFTFSLSFIPFLLRENYNVIFISEVGIGFLLIFLKKVFRFNFNVIISNGGPMPPSKIYFIDFIAQVTESEYRKSLDYGFPKEKISLLPYGIYSRKFNIQPEKTELRLKYKIPIDKYVLLSVGQINRHHKRIDFLIETFSLLNDEKYFLLIVGGNDLEIKKIKDEANSKLKDNYLFLIDVEHETMPEIYKLADCLVHCSLFEGFARVFLEAMSARIPIIAHNMENNAWPINNKECLIDMRNKYELIKKIKIFSENRTLVESIIENNYNNVVKRFDWAILKDQYLAVIERAGNSLR